MQEPVSIKVADYPKLIGKLIHSNQFLKVFSFWALILCFVMQLLFFMQMTRDPVVLPLSPEAREIEKGSAPKPELEIKRAIERYISLRYQWTPATVKKNLGAAQSFISPSSVKAYQTAIANLVEFSTQKIVEQRIYPAEIEVTLEKGSVFVSGDRITSIQGLKAAGSLNLELSFESGPRTPENPWGVYITREKESQ